MKKYIFYIVLVFSLSLGACNDWLDVPSKTEVIDYEMFKTEQGFMDGMAGVYYLMTDNKLYGDMLTMTFLDMLARRYDVSVGSYNIEGLGDGLGEAGYYAKKDVVAVIDNFWKGGYNVIANVNSLLEQMENYKSVFTYDNYRLIKGEALGIRAFMHFDLLRMFGRHYQTAGDSLAIPYVTKLSGREWPLFNTQDEVIELALRDLQLADSLLSVDDIHTSSIENSWLNSRQQHFNYLAVYGTMARIYHWKGDTEKALLYANKVIDSGQLTFFDPQKPTMQRRDIAFYTECLFCLNKEDLQKVYQDRYNTMAKKILYNQEEDIELVYEKNAGGGSDYRFTFLWYLFIDDKSNPQNPFRMYRYYRYNGGVAEKGNLVTLMRMSEMYYIAAECAGNTEEGRGSLNEIRINRGLAKVDELISDELFQKEILKEYQKEFFGEGQLFYYYKRLNQKFVLDHDYTTLVNMESPGYVFPIPENELELRKGITE